MAYPTGGFGGWPKLSEVIIAAAELGCQVRNLSGQIDGPDGPFTVRYLFNPTTQGFVVLSDIGDDEFVAPSMLSNMERRLGVPSGSLGGHDENSQ